MSPSNRILSESNTLCSLVKMFRQRAMVQRDRKHLPSSEMSSGYKKECLGAFFNHKQALFIFLLLLK